MKKYLYILLPVLFCFLTACSPYSNLKQTQIIDSGKYYRIYKEYDKAVYIPDTDNLNNTISQWNENGICFMGVFHSHPVDQETLSSDDIEYIKSIFCSMPESITELYFPVVIPKSHICSYRLKNINHRIVIIDDKIDIVF